MKPQLVSEALDTAINDGINIYMRDVVRANGFISQASHERLWERDMLTLKYGVASRLAQEVAKFPLAQPSSETFNSAISDGINIYMRDVVRALGLISDETYARLDEQDMLLLKNRIISELGAAWAKMPLTLDGRNRPS